MLVWTVAIGSVAVTLALGIAAVSSHLDRSLPEKIVDWGRYLFTPGDPSADIDSSANIDQADEEPDSSEDEQVVDETAEKLGLPTEETELSAEKTGPEPVAEPRPL